MLRLALPFVGIVIAQLFCGIAETSAHGATVLVNQVAPLSRYGYGLPFWNRMTANLQSAFGEDKITVSALPLTDLPTLLTYDSLWVTLRLSGTLTTDEQSNLSAYVAAGHRVVLIGENSTWADWNNSILSPLGGSYSGQITSELLTTVHAHALTAGVSQWKTNLDGIASPSPTGISLFSQNVATLWGTNQNVVSILGVNVFDDNFGNGPGNIRFAENLANWLATPVPEPRSVVPFGLAGLALLCIACRSLQLRASCVFIVSDALRSAGGFHSGTSSGELRSQERYSRAQSLWPT